MKGEIPGTGRFTPPGNGGAGTAALGNRTAAWARDTFLRVARDRPPNSPIAAAARPTPAATRKCRRAADAACPAGVHERNCSSPPARDPPARDPPVRDPPAPVPLGPAPAG